MNKIVNGCYPVMVIAYDKNGDVDYDAVKKLVKWYWDNGCQGIFTSCQSTEIRFLSLADRVKVTKVTVDEARRLAAEDKSRPPMCIVGSGHVSEDFEEQVTELTQVWETGVDGLVLISNRMDIAQIGEDKWIEDTKKLIDRLPADATLGMYECPQPYKRLLTEKMCKWMAECGRFAFIKDTCCDVEMIARRLEIFKDSPVGIFNANGQTVLDTLKLGAKGYSGIMANFHPKLYSWLCDNWETQPEKAEQLAQFMCMSAFTEGPVYPCSAKYSIAKYEGIDMEITARSSDFRLLTDYHKRWIEKMHNMAERYYNTICK